ncbi:hypothetical protein MNBD_GAMMA25-852 [hydrothermal vent metagenome]|uniref:Uncharacterized protein n=1 Tax=hydrothermal vent metagenome TaxID=652676 RepID=A0A3B1B9D0_9ZZZZ
MKRLKMLLLGLLLGLGVGLWFGVNLGKGQPLYSNPFDSDSLQKKANRTADEVLENTKRALRESLK